MSAPEMISTCRDEAQITSGWEKTEAPRISICCATYNHEKYVEKAIQGFLAQETSFPFEIIFRDDASTDNTLSILKKYEERYPVIIRIVAEPENRFRHGVRPIHVWPEVVSGEFVALCEGDDFWTNPQKLQKQVELLDRHPSAVMAVAETDKYLDDNGKLVYVSTLGGKGKTLLGFDDIKKNYFHTSTYVIRTGVFQSVATRYFKGHCLFGDTALRFLLITKGDFAYLPEVVSAYRKTGHGIWSSLEREQQLQWEIDAARKLCGFLNADYRFYQMYRLSKLKCKLNKLKLKRFFKDGLDGGTGSILINLFTSWVENRFRKYVYPRVT